RLLPRTTPPPCRDEAASRVGHPDLWRSQLVIVCYRKRHHHPAAMKPRRGWGTRSCGDLSFLSFATANDNPPCRDEAAPRVGHPELWRSRVGHPDLWRSRVGHPELWIACILRRIMKTSKIAAVVGVVV